MQNREQISILALKNNPISARLRQIHTKHEAPLILKQEILRKKIDEAHSLNSAIKHFAEDTGNAEAIDLQADTIIFFFAYQYRDIKKKLKVSIKLKDIFKANHGRLQEPKNSNVVTSILTLILAGAGEALAGSLFFVSASLSANFGSAILTSSLMSFTNVLASSLGGAFIGRWLNYGENHSDGNHPQIKYKRWAAHIRFSAFVAVMFIFHLTVTLIRTQEDLHFIQHSFEAYKQILHVPEAIFLAITSVSLSIIAWFKGKHISDSYGDYGEYQTAIDGAKNEWLDIREEATEKVNELFDEAIAEQGSKHKQHDKQTKKYNRLVDACNNAYSDLTKAVSLSTSQFQSEKAEILDIYHTASDTAEIPPVTSDAEIFKEYLNVELPKHLPMSQNPSYRSQLNEVKAKALEKLNSLFAESDQ